MPGTGESIQRRLRRRAEQLRDDASSSPGAPFRGVPTRRTLLTGAVASGAGLALAGPLAGPAAASPRAPQGSGGDRGGPRVVVVGAGLAGLTCAYRLRQQGVTAQVFEARPDRLGGRCWTARGFEQGQVAEHGGEFIDTRHVHIRRIARELGLTLEDREAATGGGSVSPLWLRGRLRDEEAVYAGFDDVVRRLTREYRRIGSYRAATATRAAREFDEMSAADWLRDNVDDVLLRDALTIGQSGFFGIDTNRMSAINLLEAYVAPYPGADERYHVHGGNDRIPYGMARTLGRGAIRRDAPLLALRRRGNGSYALRFGGVRGEVHADYVVLSLPFTALRDVDLAHAGLSARRLRAIHRLGMGTNAKNHVQLRVRPKRLGDWSGDMTMDAPHPQSSWESTAGQTGSTSVVTIWRGGRSGAGYPTDVAHRWAPERIVRGNLAAFERGVPGVTAAFNGLSWLDSWVDDPWVRGSYAGFLRAVHPVLGLPEAAGGPGPLRRRAHVHPLAGLPQRWRRERRPRGTRDPGRRRGAVPVSPRPGRSAAGPGRDPGTRRTG